MFQSETSTAMKVLLVGAALVCACAAHSQLYVQRIKKRNSHLSHPPAEQNPPLPDLYGAGSQTQYTQLYGGAPQDSYRQLYGGSAQQQQQQRGGGGGGYGRPEPEEDEYEPGYGQQVPTRAPPSKRPISYPRPTQNPVKTTRQPWSHQQTITHRQPNPGYQPQKLSTTRRPISYPRPTARTTTTTRRPSGYPGADPEDLDTPGYGQPPRQPAYPQPTYPQPTYPQPTAQKKPSNGGYGNDLDDLEQPGYGGRPTTSTAKQTSGGGYGNADLEDVETGGYGGPARQTQDIYGNGQLYPAESQVVPRRKSSSSYNVAQEIPDPAASTQANFFEARSNPDYFPHTRWNTPAIATAPAFQLQTVQQPLGYLVVDHAAQW
ncbi:extensin-like [Galendromus occidentalis]|uniref:Extensin-like n=1 Tax=Galendromus occidentalis TaxID=34638 RepID=A0AAJ6W000_9ACAR|nr:extensin-like [Galendromus occidentalis]